MCTLAAMSDAMVMQGRRLSGADLELIRGLLGEHPQWCRSRLSVELCERWDWRNARGRIKDMAARTLLLKLERAGHIRLPARIHALERQVQELTARLEASEQRVRQLEEQRAKDSHNSSKPPSSDGLGKPKPKSLRPRSRRPSGGQPGHPGQTLQAAEKPDHTLRHPVTRCSDCGRVNRAAFPPEATAPVQYGTRIKSVAVCLHARLLGAVRQQPVRARPAHDETAPEDLRHLPQLHRTCRLLSNPRLRGNGTKA
jgi:hypothetical protein